LPLRWRLHLAIKEKTTKRHNNLAEHSESL
jgi:hypothetical protein